MKLLLTISVIAMISAGIYGIIDLSQDISSGTMIEYDKPDPVAKSPSPVVTASVMATAGIHGYTTNDSAKVMEAQLPPAITNEEQEVTITDLEFADFSRAAPRGKRHQFIYEEHEVIANDGDTLTPATSEEIAKKLQATQDSIAASDSLKIKKRE